jgi:hypothetical protein
MRKRNWKTYRPISLSDAIEACLEYAREKHNRSVDRIADLMGLPSKWVVYKWVESGAMPVRLVPAFEHAAGCTFVTAWLAGAAHRFLIEIPTGRDRSASDVHALQEACNAAVGAVLAFHGGTADAAQTLGALTAAIESLAFERANVERHHQPELDLQ